MQPCLEICREVQVGAPTYQLPFIDSDLQSSTSTAGYEKRESSSLILLKSAGGKGKPVGLNGWAPAWAVPGPGRTVGATRPHRERKLAAGSNGSSARGTSPWHIPVVHHPSPAQAVLLLGRGAGLPWLCRSTWRGITFRER